MLLNGVIDVVLEIKIYSNHFQYLIPIWECLKLDPRILNTNTKTLTPTIVYKLTRLPKVEKQRYSYSLCNSTSYEKLYLLKGVF